MAKTAIVTGASRGLGAAAAVVLGKMGANVTLLARSADDLAQVASDVQAAGGAALVVAGDVSQEADCRRAVEETVARYGRLDALINNAGMLQPVGRIFDVDMALWKQNLLVNVWGPALLTQAALPYLRERSGRVINVSSGAAVRAIEGWGAYCVSKAALNHLTRLLAAEEASITAVALRPGVVDTAMQSEVRETGGGAMTEEAHGRFMQLKAKGELLPPRRPGRALAVLALHAPREFSGEFLQWDAPEVQQLVETYAPPE